MPLETLRGGGEERRVAGQVEVEVEVEQQVEVGQQAFLASHHLLQLGLPPRLDVLHGVGVVLPGHVQ